MPTPWPQPRPLITHLAPVAPAGQASAASAATQATRPTAALVLSFAAICLGAPNTLRGQGRAFDRRRPFPSVPYAAGDPLTAGVLSARSRDWRFQMSIATQEQTVVDQVEKHLYIGGEWRDASGEGALTVEDPSTGEALCEIADATPEDAKAALDAAVAAQAEWAETPPNEL